MDKRIKLKFIYHNMTRSNRAYQMYKNKPTYYNACHIYNANKIIYDSINQLLIDDLTEEHFQAFDDHIPFPKNFLKIFNL